MDDILKLMRSIFLIPVFWLDQSICLSEDKNEGDDLKISMIVKLR